MNGRPFGACYDFSKSFSDEIITYSSVKLRGKGGARNNLLLYFAYNFLRIQGTLRTSPAMAAGVTNKLWEVSDLVALWEEYERREERAA